MRRLHQLFNLSLIDELSLGAARAAVVILIIMMLLISVEVFIRKSFGMSTRLAHEYSGYLLVALSFWAAAEVLNRGRHIRITTLIDHFNQKFQSFLCRANYVVAFAFITILFWATTRLVIHSYQTGMLTMGVYQIPIFIPQLAIPIGLFFFMVQIAANLFKMFRPPKKND